MAGYLRLKQNIRLMQLYPNRSALKQIPSDLRRSADAVSDGVKVYLRQAEQKALYTCDISTGQMTRDFDCKYFRCSMIMYHGKVVTVGGARSKDVEATHSNELLQYDPSRYRWVPILPPMPTKRSRTTALVHLFGTGYIIIVIGGVDERGRSLKTVEIFDTVKHEWRKAQDLPEERHCSSGAIADGYVYILGGWKGVDNPTSAVIRCSLLDLVSTSTTPQRESIWKGLADLPVEEAVCTSFQNKIHIIGGRANDISAKEIRTYNSDHDRWDVIGYLKDHGTFVLL